MLLARKVLRWQTMGIGNRKKRSGRQIPPTIYRRHRKKTPEVRIRFESTVGLLPWPDSCPSPQLAIGRWSIYMARCGPAGTSDHTRPRYLRLRFPKSTEKVSALRVARMVVGVVWFGARLLLDRGRVEVSFQGRTLITADGARRLRILFSKRPRLSLKYSIRLFALGGYKLIE